MLNVKILSILAIAGSAAAAPQLLWGGKYFSGSRGGNNDAVATAIEIVTATTYTTVTASSRRTHSHASRSSSTATTSDASTSTTSILATSTQDPLALAPTSSSDPSSTSAPAPESSSTSSSSSFPEPVAPSTTVVSTTSVVPSTTVVSTTPVAPSTTAVSTTPVAPSTTAVSTTTVAPSTSASSAAPAASSSSSATGYMVIVNKWRVKMSLVELIHADNLEANALKTVTDDNGTMAHELNPGSFAQVLAPGSADDFENVFVGGWLCERPDLPGLDGICTTMSQGWDYEGQTGHADILVSTSYTKIGCAQFVGTNGVGIWGCDLA